ncbi:MAG TPA: hypothetical protein VET48_02435 [Steroidobacteraceae bacterium]|nr:hypothetical protein [Steroidobacteraceae bacterium]
MVNPFEISSVVGAIGALGLASFALVDATKVGRKGGVSNSGFIFIERAVQQLLPDEQLSEESESDKPRTLLDIVHGNWIAGQALADQKAIAKSLIKLRLSEKNAKKFAAATEVDEVVLGQVAAKMKKGDDLTSSEANALGRFDLALTALLDEGYQRADQRYRNATRVIASIISIVLAVFGGWAVTTGDGATAMSASQYFFRQPMWMAFFCGLLATPLAPISKDLASALQAGVKVAQSLKK